MFKQEYTVQNKTGLHARPAGQLVALCKALPNEIRLVTEKGAVNPKNILGILTAGLKQGSTFTLEVEGDDAAQVGEKIIAFLNELAE